MSLVTEFKNTAAELGINKCDFYEENGQEYTILSFSEIGEKTLIKTIPYNVALVFYSNDNEVEIFVRKKIESKNIVQVFNQVNNLNAEYRGVAFYLEDTSVVIKSYVQTEGNIEKLLKQMVSQVDIAKEEFKKIK